MRWPGKFGLAAKFNALIVASILATTLGTVALTVREESAAYMRQLLSDGAALAAMVSQNSEYALYTENRDALRQVVQDLNAYPSVAYVRFADKDGRSLLERAFHSIAMPPLEHHARAVGGTDAAVDEYQDRLDGSVYLDVVVPVRGAGAEVFRADRELGRRHGLVVEVEARVEQLPHAGLDAVGQLAGDDDQRLLGFRHGPCL